MYQGVTWSIFHSKFSACDGPKFLDLVSANTTHTHTAGTLRTDYIGTHTHCTHYVYREPIPKLYYSIPSTKETLYKPRETHRILSKAKYTLLLIPLTVLGSYTQK